MKKIINLILGVVVLLAVLFFAKNAIAKVLIETGVKTVTGLPLKMQGIDLNFPGQFVEIDDLKLFNPAGFSDDAPMVHIPEIYVAYDLATLLKGKVHLPELRFAMEEFNVVRNEKGELNLDKLKALAAQKPAQSGQTEPAKPAKPAEIQIDSFTLKVGRVQFKDYSSGTPSVKKFEIGLNETFKNITDPNALVALIVSKALMSTTIAQLTNFDLAGLQSSVTGAVGSLASESLGQLQGAAGQLGAAVDPNQVMGKAEETAKEAASALKSKASSLTGGFANKLKSL